MSRVTSCSGFAGGVYYIISRSLGPEFGASIGLVFAFANTVAASMNTIGFCDSLNDLLRSHGLQIVDGGVNDVRIVGTVAILVMCIICAVGMEWESKVVKLFNNQETSKLHCKGNVFLEVLFKTCNYARIILKLFLKGSRMAEVLK
jgi:amino acid transporter